MDNQHRIYMIECVPTGKRYVGSASFIVQRFSRHRNDLRKGAHCNKPLQNAWNKYGEGAFRFVELECVLNKNDLVSEEQRWLDELNPAFNVARTAGSCLGCRHSSESRAKRSERTKQRLAAHPWPKMSDETRKRIGDAQRGKHRVFSEHHLLALSRAAIGRRLSQETKEKIRQAHLGTTKAFSVEHKAAIKAAWAKRKLTRAVARPEFF